MRDRTAGLAVPRRHRVVKASVLPERQGIVAFLSREAREGPWRVATGTRVVSTPASVLLDSQAFGETARAARKRFKRLRRG